MRSLIDGNPIDRTQDRLSESILNAFDTEDTISVIESALRLLIENTFTSVHSNISDFYSRPHPRICSLADILGIVCNHSMNAIEIFGASLSNEVLHLFEDALTHDQYRSIDTLWGSVILGLLSLLSTFVNNDIRATSNDDETRASTLSQRRNVKERLTRTASFWAVLDVAMSQGKSADMTRRALNVQKALTSVIDERSLATTFTKASESIARKKTTLCNKLAQTEKELQNLTVRLKQVEMERDTWNNSFHDQRLSYERQLECTRSEAQTIVRNVSQIHVDERRQAEDLYYEEREIRISAEQENEKLTREQTSEKARIRELENLLKQEREARKEFESSLETCKTELSTTLEELERSSNDCHELQDKLSTAEEQVSDLTSINEDAEANLEETCSKLVNLATIFQCKEIEMEKYKKELRSAVNTANQDADNATQKYASAKQTNRALTKQLEGVKTELKEVKGELTDIKAHRADAQRMRKNNPVSYINQMHKEPKKAQGRRRAGKENSFDDREK